MKITAPYPAPTAPRTAIPQGRLFNFQNIGPAFWTVTSLISILINLVLFVVVIMLGSQIFSIKRIVSDQLIGGLYNNFMQMDQAHIRTPIPVKASVPAKFDLPLKTETVVRLTQDTFIPRRACFPLRRRSDNQQRADRYYPASRLGTASSSGSHCACKSKNSSAADRRC